MAAEFCREVGGKRLILTHFSQRYRREGEEVGEEEEGVGEEGVGKLLGEAREALIGTGIRVEIADDFKTFVIPAKINSQYHNYWCFYSNVYTSKQETF